MPPVSSLSITEDVSTTVDAAKEAFMILWGLYVPGATRGRYLDILTALDALYNGVKVFGVSAYCIGWHDLLVLCWLADRIHSSCVTPSHQKQLQLYGYWPTGDGAVYMFYYCYNCITLAVTWAHPSLSVESMGGQELSFSFIGSRA